MRARLFPLALAIASCMPGAAPPNPGVSAVDPCFIAQSSTSLADSVIVSAEGVISPIYGLGPTTPVERIVFAQTFETLVLVTCEGRLAPALADRWVGDSTGRVWTLTIRPGAQFSDGAAITADDVAMAWKERYEYFARGEVRGPSLDGVTIEGERQITVRLRHPHRDGPRLLADPSFAVHRRNSDVIAPMGTGPYRDPDPYANPLVLVPRVAGAAPVLIVRGVPFGDARDLIDRGIDLLVTRDRRVAEYAATRRELSARPLAPDRAYVILAAARPANAAALDPDDDPRLPSLRASLARDVVRGKLPSAEPWWGSSEQVAGCTIETPPSTPASTPSRPSSRTRRLVYPSGDRLAGELAQRLVALAAYDRGTSAESVMLREWLPRGLDRGEGPLVAAGLGDAELSRSLERGADLGYLIVLPRRSLDSCEAWRDLAARAPWVTVGAPALLAEAGPTLITGPRAPALIVDWDNSLRVVTQTAPVRDPQ